MKKNFYVSAVTFLMAGSLSAEVVEAIVARVGDRIITRSQYANRLRGGLDELGQRAPADQVATQRAKYRDELLNEMLSELLIKDRADRLGLTVAPAEVNEAVERLKRQYGLKTDDEFNDSLRKSGMTRPEMEAKLRDSLITNKVFGKELRSRGDLSDRELRERYDRERETYRKPERARVREIVTMPADPASPASVAEASSKANKLLARIRGGEDFGVLAGQMSDAPSKSAAGDLGEIAKGELRPELDRAVFSAEPGKIVGPIQTKAGFHVLKVEERMPSEVPSFDSIKEQLRKDVGEETFQRDLKAYVEKLKSEAFLQVYEANLPKG